MKKDRNAFFQNQSSSSYFYPNNNMPASGMPGAYPGAYPMATESSSNFYQGPILTPVNGLTSEYNSELENRLAKIERQINRLDTRLSKIESEVANSNSSQEFTTNNNMYMI